MTVLVVGASGATGRRLVEELLERGRTVRVIVRSPRKLPDSLRWLPTPARDRCDSQAVSRWRGRMPVIYDEGFSWPDEAGTAGRRSGPPRRAAPR
jgi:nucleoside-diphosphate-sugar epimerase